MKIRVIESLEDLEMIRKPWNTIIRLNPEIDLPFYSWEWFYYSWKYYNDGASLSVIVAEDKGEIIGIFPLIQTRQKRFGVVYNELSFCNSSNTPRHTILVSEVANEKNVMKNIISYLLSERNKWDTIRLTNIPESTICHEYFLVSELKYAIIQEIGRLSPVVGIKNEDTFKEYFQKHASRDTRRRFKRNVNRLCAHNKSWDLRIYSSGSEIQDGISAVITVRKNSWKGEFRTNRYPLFISEVSKALSLSGNVFIAVLFIDNHPVAAQYILRKDKRYYAITNDFDMNYRELAPGSCLLYYLMIRAFEESWDFFDFTGDAYDYKKSIANVYVKHSSFQVFHPGFKSRMIFYGKTKLLPLLRNYLRRSADKNVVSVRSYSEFETRLNDN